MRSQADAPRPTQIAFIAAGFFFARSEFLMDVPFDPYVRKCKGTFEGMFNVFGRH
jgi:Glycosyltransferase (GlcNAc)